MRQRGRSYSIKTILSVAIASVSILFTVLVSTILYVQFTGTIRSNATVATREIVRQINANLNYYTNDILSIATYARDLAKQTDVLSHRQIEERLNSIVSSRQDIVCLLLLKADGTLLLSTNDAPMRETDEIVTQQWFERASGKEGNFYFTGPHVQQLFPSSYPWVITYSQQITYRNDEGELDRALLVIDMNFWAVSELVQTARLGKSGYVYFIDNDGKIVYHPYQQLINSNLFNEDIESVQEHIFGTFHTTFEGRERLVIVDTVNNARWRVVGVAFIDELMAGLQKYTAIMMVFVLFCIVITIIVARSIAAYISRPIRVLERLMNSVESGNFSSPPLVGGSQEVAALSETFAVMVRRIRALMDDIVTSQEAKRKFELDALQAKINPHFLYNTLDSVVWMAEQGDSEGVIRMVTSLAKLFRISISKGRDIITIAEELEHVRNYLIIQQIRYQEKFEFSIEMEAGTEQLTTIKLIVQPIVENAIYHGIKYLQEMGNIAIRVYRRKPGAVVIEVRDNGVGMSEAQLTQILDFTTLQPKKMGFGVRNVHQRIQLYWGSDFGLEISSELDVGTLVRLIIPEQPPIAASKGVTT